MSDLKAQITDLAQLMTEFGLEEARISGEDWKVEFSRRVPHAPIAATPVAAAGTDETASRPARAAKPAAPAGIPLTSPMMGIFYNAPSPSAAPFVREGDSVTAGQVVGLIEAMKVFNEIPSPLSGKVTKVVAENGQLVQPGEPLLYVE